MRKNIKVAASETVKWLLLPPPAICRKRSRMNCDTDDESITRMSVVGRINMQSRTRPQVGRLSCSLTWHWQRQGQGSIHRV